MPDPAHDDAEMRANGERLLEGVDLAEVRPIGLNEAERIAMEIEAGEAIPRDDVLALALWAAKGGVMRT